MRRGFTIVELVFVIVVIGIVSAIAIPKIVAVRDDAIYEKMETDIKTIITDFSAYYLTHGEFPKTASEQILRSMTTIPLYYRRASDTWGGYYSTPISTMCITISYDRHEDGAKDVFRLTPIDDIIKKDKYCKMLSEMPIITNLPVDTVSKNPSTAGTRRVVKVGYSMIKRD